MTEKNSLQLENLKLTILCISVSLAVGIAAIALLLQFHLIFALAIAVIAAGGTGWSISTRLIDGRWPSPQPVLACLLWVAVAYGTWPGIKPFEPASRGTYASKQDYIRERSRELNANRASESFQATVGDFKAVWVIWYLPNGQRRGELVDIDGDGRVRIVGDTEHLPANYSGTNPSDIFGQDSPIE